MRGIALNRAISYVVWEFEDRKNLARRHTVEEGRSHQTRNREVAIVSFARVPAVKFAHLRNVQRFEHRLPYRAYIQATSRLVKGSAPRISKSPRPDLGRPTSNVYERVVRGHCIGNCRCRCVHVHAQNFAQKAHRIFCRIVGNAVVEVVRAVAVWNVHEPVGSEDGGRAVVHHSEELIVEECQHRSLVGNPSVPVDDVANDTISRCLMRVFDVHPTVL